MESTNWYPSHQLILHMISNTSILLIHIYYLIYNLQMGNSHSHIKWWIKWLIDKFYIKPVWWALSPLPPIIPSVHSLSSPLISKFWSHGRIGTKNKDYLSVCCCHASKINRALSIVLAWQRLDKKSFFCPILPWLQSHGWIGPKKKIIYRDVVTQVRIDRALSILLAWHIDIVGSGRNNCIAIY